MTRAIACVAFLALLSGGAQGNSLPYVLPNDNGSMAGRLSHDTLELHLVVGMAVWRPEADSGPSIEVAAFAEEGKSPQVPAPLIRVPAGTTISATVRNALADSTLRIYGLATRPASIDDSLVIAPGESRSVTFRAGTPGSYLYWASLGHSNRGPEAERIAEREQLGGAFLVDPAGGSPPDRVLVINVWGNRIDSTRYRTALTINGRSWPHTERLEATRGRHAPLAGDQRAAAQSPDAPARLLLPGETRGATALPTPSIPRPTGDWW